VYLWRQFSPFLGNSRTDDHPPTKKPVEGNDTYLNPGKKCKQLLLQISNLVHFAGTNVLKMGGHSFGWGNGHDLVGCDGISHHIPIAFFFSEILHATHVSNNTVLIQSLMHLSMTKSACMEWLSV